MQNAFTGIPADVLKNWIPPYDRFINMDLSSFSMGSPPLNIPRDFYKFGNSEDEDDLFSVPFFDKKTVFAKWPGTLSWLETTFRQFNSDAFVNPLNPYDFYTHSNQVDISSSKQLKENDEKIAHLDKIKTSIFKKFSNPKTDPKDSIDINTVRKTGKCPENVHRISRKDSEKILFR
jgi:hypothetical protein